MSGIFNLFGSTNVTPRNHQRAGFPDTSGSLSMKGSNVLGSLKQGSTLKPKGLSVRPKTDLNVCIPSQKTSTLVKNKNLNTLDCSMRPSTPRQKETVSKLQIVREKQLKSLSPTSKLPFFNLTINQKGSDDILFKKPATPRSTERKRRIYPAPENIPKDMNTNDPWGDIDLDKERSELKLIFRAKSLVSLADEGFESDPELIPTPPMSPIKSQIFDYSIISDLDLEAPEIPTISDNDDDDDDDNDNF